MSTSSPYQLSLSAAILININIIIGAGMFVNTVLLAKSAGGFGGLAYLAMGFLLLPLVITFARLLKHYKGGTFYDFGVSLHPLAGFISSWSYFVAKLAPASLSIHVFSTLAQQLLPVLTFLPTILLDIIIVALFSILNTLNLRIGRSIQYGFLSIKSIPILFAIGVGLYLFSPSSFYEQRFEIMRIAQSLPFVLYAFTGFEACCSLSRTIQNPERNGPKALLISYALGVTIAVLYQMMFFGSLGTTLPSLVDYTQAFPTLISRLFSYGTGWYSFLFFICTFGIATSALGAAYGVMYSNAWNLFVLAQNGHTFFAKPLSTLNKYHIPFLCVVIEGLIIVAYVLLTLGNLIPLQQICSLGMIITYCISTLALLQFTWKVLHKLSWIALGALLSCIILLLGYKNNIAAYGIYPTIYFCCILLLGIGMFWMRQTSTQRRHA